MPSLIPEILFAIAKQLIEDGNSEKALVKFALSGKQQLNAVKNVIYSVTSLELYDNHFAVGWDKECSKLKCKKLPKSWVYLIGGSVTNLYVQNQIKTFFKPMISAIIDRKKLIYFSAGINSHYCNTLSVIVFLPVFSTTLKELTIPCDAMSKLFLDKLRLESLTFLVELKTDWKSVIRCFSNTEKSRQFLTSIKNITFDGLSSSLRTKHIMDVSKLFSSLETINFNSRYIDFWDVYFFAIDKNNLIDRINLLTTFPTKIVNILFIDESIKDAFDNICKVYKDFRDFDYDSSNPEYHCFRKIIHSSKNSQSVPLEILYHKVGDEIPKFLL